MRRAVRSSVSLFVVCACCLGVLVVAPAARAEVLPSSAPDAGVSFTDGTVDAIATAPNGITYIGGDFTHVRIDTGGGVALSAASGARDVRFPRVDGEVWATVADGTGGFYIGGSFAKVGSMTRNNIAHILVNGDVDPAFDPNANSDVWALAVSGSTVYVGGYFTSIGGQTRNRIAALDATSGAAMAWDPNASLPAGSGDASVAALVVSGSRIYVGGKFTSIGGQARNSIAALDATSGAATAWNPNATWYGDPARVLALAVSGSTVYAGGYFYRIGGQPRDMVAALDASSGLATPWNLQIGEDGNGVLALAVSGSTVYIGGNGDMQAAGTGWGSFALAVDATTGEATAWNPEVSLPGNDGGAYVNTLVVSGSTVYLGGAFTSIGGQTRNRIAAVSATTGAATAWDPNASGAVYALAVSGPTVYAGGEFRSVGLVARNHLAALDSSGALTAWDPSANNTVRALAGSGSTGFAGGDFTSIGGQTRYGIAALDATSGAAAAWDPHSTYATYTVGSVEALAVSGSTIYAGGYFDTIGGQSRNGIAALDATSGLATAWNPNPGGTYLSVDSFAVSGSTVYVGGQFTFIGGQTRNNIAALDASSGAATSWNPNARGTSYPGVSALAVSGSTVYVGGQFTSIGGQARNNIAALDAGSGAATSWNPDASDSAYPSYDGVRALVVSGSTVYAGGWFDTIGGQTRNNIAALDAASGVATTWNPDASRDTDDPSLSVVNALAVSRWTIYAGGSFPSISEQGRQYLARFVLRRRQIHHKGHTVSAVASRRQRAGDKWGNLR